MYSFGGEMEWKHEDCFQYITDSGRSSLRLILQGEELEGHKFLIPDFICSSVIIELERNQVEYAFYHVNSDLTLDIESIKNQSFDVLYLINYFGQEHDCAEFTGKGLKLIEDCRFMINFSPRDGFSAWAGFNSYRVNTAAADGSVLLSTFQLPKSLINTRPAPFSRFKYEAKRIKYEFIKNDEHCEEEFLTKFREAEKMIDEQEKIYQMSERSSMALFEFFRNYRKEKKVRRRNYKVLEYELGDRNVKLKTKFPSFFVLNVDRRDELRESLFAHNIFLPVHWQAPPGCSNPLYSRLLSVPVDSRYNIDDIVKVSNDIKNFYEN